MRGIPFLSCARTLLGKKGALPSLTGASPPGLKGEKDTLAERRGI